MSRHPPRLVKRPPPTPEQIQRLKSDFEDGVSTAVLAKRIGVGRALLLRMIRGEP